MNTSQKTKLVAEGMSLFASFMDLPHTNYADTAEWKAWSEWFDKHPEWMTYVMQEHHALFDRINARF